MIYNANLLHSKLRYTNTTAPWSVMLHYNWRPLFNAYEAILAKPCGTKDLF